MEVAGSYAVTLFLLVTLNFFLPRALPGDPLVSLSDPRSATYVGDDERRAAVEAYYGLDRPMVEQYGHYLGGLLTGDLGTSIQTNASVAGLLAERLPWTLLLVGTGLIAATVIGILAGIYSGWRRDHPSDKALFSFFVTLDNIPVFFLGSVVVYIFAAKLGWFPLSGARTPFSGSWRASRQVMDVARHLVLPAGLMSLQFASFQYLVMRAGMVGELGSDHLWLGRAKGLSERVLKYRYAARNALVPAVSVFALQAGFAATATIFVETIFSYPGLGRLMFESVGNRDYPTMQGVFLLLAAIVLSANFLADMVHRRLDPRTQA
ncbi:ABC transporter permease [soil metagenome]